MPKVKTWSQAKIASIRKTRRGYLESERLIQRLADMPSHMRNTIAAGGSGITFYSEWRVPGLTIRALVREYRAFFKTVLGEWSDKLTRIDHWYGDTWITQWTGHVGGILLNFSIEGTQKEIEEEGLLKPGCSIVERTEKHSASETTTSCVECST